MWRRMYQVVVHLLAVVGLLAIIVVVGIYRENKELVRKGE